MASITFTGIFDKYTPVNSEPHYVFKSETIYLIKCKDYPYLISKLAPEDLVNIEADIFEQCSDGIKLVNVKFGDKDE